MSQKIRSLQLLNHALTVCGLLYCFLNNEFSILFYSLFTLVLMVVLGINIGFHRYLTHRSFKTNIVIEHILLFCGTISLLGTPLTWSISHINHHAYPDIEGDPYSPHRISTWDYLMTRFEPVKHARLGMRQLTQNNCCMFFHTNYLKVIGFYCLILLLINPLLIVYMFSIPATLALYLILLTNILCHTKGYRNYDTKDNSTNNILITILTLGEGYHNNHHHDPSNYSNRVKWYEIDITGMIIRIIKNG